MDANHLIKRFKDLGYNPKFRKNGNNFFITDAGNQIIDLHLEAIEDSIKLEREIKLIPGVVEVGLFNNIANKVIVGRNNSIEIFNRV